GLDLYANFRVRCDAVYALNYVMIATQHVALDISMPVRDRFAPCELAPRFDIDVHFGSFHQSRVDRHAYGEWIIHGCSGRTELGREPNQIFRCRVDEIVNRPMGCAE